jgi:hypothetical protein
MSATGVRGWSRAVRLTKRIASSAGNRSSVKPLATNSGGGAMLASILYAEW